MKMEQNPAQESSGESVSAVPLRPAFAFDATTVSLGLAVVGLAVLLYVLTAARDIVVGDTPELITAAVTLGVPHPPGYPLYTMLGHLFSLLPVGPIPFRVNLLSVTCDALAVGVVYLTALRLSGGRWAAAAAALILAVTPVFWKWSLVSEVFPLNNLLASILIYLLVAWCEKPARTGFLIAAAFVSGLALTNHQTIVLLAPACFFILWRGRAVLWSRPQVLFFCGAAFCLGLLPYLYVFWASARHPVYNWGNVSSLRDLAVLIARRSYGSGSLVSVVEYRGGSSLSRIIALSVSFGPLAGALTVLGAIQAYRKVRWYVWFCLIAFAFAGLFFVSITELNLATAPHALFVLERFFILSHVVLAPLLAFGLLFIAKFIASPIWRRILITGLGLGVVGTTVLLNYRRIDQSQNHVARSFGQDVFASVGPDSMLLARGDAVVLPLVYLRQVEGLRRDVRLILLPLLPADWYVRQVREQYPDLVIPFDRYDGQGANLRMLLEANPKRAAVIVGNLPENDQSLDESYRPYQYGLVTLVEPKSRERHTLAEWVSDYVSLSKRYHPPSPAAVKGKGFEGELLSCYAQPAFLIGREFERNGAKRESRNWYERALATDPDFLPAREALARLSQ